MRRQPVQRRARETLRFVQGLLGLPPRQGVGQDLPDQPEPLHQSLRPVTLRAEAAERHDPDDRAPHAQGDDQLGLHAVFEAVLPFARRLLGQIAQPGDDNRPTFRDASGIPGEDLFRRGVHVGEGVPLPPARRPGLKDLKTLGLRRPLEDRAPIHVQELDQPANGPPDLPIHLACRQVDEPRRDAGQQPLEAKTLLDGLFRARALGHVVHQAEDVRLAVGTLEEGRGEGHEARFPVRAGDLPLLPHQVLPLAHPVDPLLGALLHLRVRVDGLVPPAPVDLLHVVPGDLGQPVIPDREPQVRVLGNVVADTQALGGALDDSPAEGVLLAQGPLGLLAVRDVAEDDLAGRAALVARGRALDLHVDGAAIGAEELSFDRGRIAPVAVDLLHPLPRRRAESRVHVVPDGLAEELLRRGPPEHLGGPAVQEDDLLVGVHGNGDRGILDQVAVASLAVAEAPRRAPHAPPELDVPQRQQARAQGHDGPDAEHPPPREVPHGAHPRHADPPRPEGGQHTGPFHQPPSRFQARLPGPQPPQVGVHPAGLATGFPQKPGRTRPGGCGQARPGQCDPQQPRPPARPFARNRHSHRFLFPLRGHLTTAPGGPRPAPAPNEPRPSRRNCPIGRKGT